MLGTAPPITGISAGHVLRTIDFRPANGGRSAVSASDTDASTAQLYRIDLTTSLATSIGGVNGVPSPDGGVFTVIGSSGFQTGTGLGFDISGATGIAYVAVDDFIGSPGLNAEFFSIDLSTGAFTEIGADDLWDVLDISVRPSSSVPVPSTLALLGLGLVAAGLSRRRGARG